MVDPSHGRDSLCANSSGNNIFSRDKRSEIRNVKPNFINFKAVVSFAFVRRLKRNSAPSSDNRKEVTEHQQGVVWATSAL